MILLRNFRVNLLLLIVSTARPRANAMIVVLRHSWHWVRIASDACDDAAAVRAVRVVLGIVRFAVFVAALAFVEEGVCFLCDVNGGSKRKGMVKLTSPWMASSPIAK